MKRLTDAQEDLLHFVSGALVVFPDDVKDVVQDINYSLISHAKEYRTELPFLPWAITFAKNHIRVYIQKQKREKLVFDNDLLDLYEKSAFAADSEPDTASKNLKHLSICLKKLPQEQHRLIDLHYMQRRTLRQIARDESKSESTIHMAVFRARKALADCIGRLCRLEKGGCEREIPYTAFDELLMQVIDEQNPLRAPDFFQELHSAPEGMGLFAEQMNVHLLLKERAGVNQTYHLALEQRRKTKEKTAAPLPHWKSLAAAAGIALLASGIIFCRTLAKRSPAQPCAPEGSEQERKEVPVAVVKTTAKEEVKTQTPTAQAVSRPLETASAEKPHAQKAKRDENMVQIRDFTSGNWTTAGQPSAVGDQTKERKQEMDKGKALRAVTVAAIAAAQIAQNAAASSESPVLGALYVNQPRFWQTAYTNEIPILWEWGPTNAAKASLAYKAMNASGSNTFSRADGPASFFLPSATTDEDLYTLVLTYADSNGNALSVLTGRVASVKGVAKSGATTPATIDATSASTTLPKVQAWPRVKRPEAKCDNAVFAYDAAWVKTNATQTASLIIAKQNDSATLTTVLDGKTGWYGWELVQSAWKYGWFTLTLNADSDNLSASVYRPSQGFVLYLK